MKRFNCRKAWTDSESQISIEARDGVHCRCVTPWRRICSGSEYREPLCETHWPSSCKMTRKPRAIVQKSSKTEMSKLTLVTASHTPISVPMTESIAVKKLLTLRCVTRTPFGLPVEPEVYNT
jgi:hypothetical protein